jgi:hypothetical protein
MPSHKGKEAAVFSTCRIELLPDFEEVVVDEPDDMEPVGHDLGIREETFCNASVGFGEIHDDDPDLKLVKKPLERALEGKFGASEEDIMDSVFGEVAEGCGITLFSCKEVLVDAEDSWAWIIFHLRELVLKEILVTAFDRGLSDLKLFRESFLADTVPVFFKDFPTECFSGALVGKDAWETIVKVFFAGLTEIFAGSEIEDDFSGTETFMAYPAIEGIFDS